MKRFIVVLSSLLMLPAFAEVAPVYYDDFVEYSDDFVEEGAPEETTEDVNSGTQQKAVTQRATANRSTSRAISNTKASSSNTRAVAASGRNAQRTSRSVTSRTAKPASGNIAQKSSNQRARVVSRSGRTSQPVTARVSATGTSVMAKPVSTTAYSQNTLTDSGVSYYNGTNARIGSVRRATLRAATTSSEISGTQITDADVSNTTSNLEAITELTEYCKTQYAACMDNYCNVLDDNQGRCSCSKNIKNYAATEAALEKATEEFQDTVQKIKYIGLTADQINSLFLETEAESAMKSTKDTSSLKTTLDRIKDKILVDATSPNASSSYTGNISMDLSGLLNIDLTSGFDLGSFLNMDSASTSNVSNQRGEQLYKTATARCKTSVLNSCTAQGIDSNIITNSYDLEIDKQCMAYERNLNEANMEMRTNARNAATILQQARLMLAQNKNSYDLRGCVAAIDACMQDDYVCGSDYESCLDPTGKYLAGGAVVKGGTPGVAGGTVVNQNDICDPADFSTTDCEHIGEWLSGGMYDLYSTWDYGNGKNAWGGGVGEKLGEYIEEKLNSWKSVYTNESMAPNDIATYLLQKIGYIDDEDKAHGMCASVMKQCQDYTFSNVSRSSKRYIPNNEVVRQYLSTALSKIKLQQDAIIADYAEDCRSDVSSCLSTNGYDEQNTGTTASKSAVNACRAEIVTCMSATGQKPKDPAKLTLRVMKNWIDSMLIVCQTNYYVKDDGENAVTCELCGKSENNISLVSSGGQSNMCYCPEGYTATESLDNGFPKTCTKDSE